MKLYATVTSERNSRPAKKGGDEKLTITIYKGNLHTHTIHITPEANAVHNASTGYVSEL